MTEPRRIKPAKRNDAFIEMLLEEGVFETKQAAMMFAAAVGYRYDSRQALDAGGEGIRWSIFEKNRDDAFINALALAVKRDLAVLDSDAAQNDDLATIFEEYAAGGFEYLNQYVRDTPGDVLDNLLALIQQFRTSQRETPAGLEGLDRSALELLGELEP
ncbi:MAG: DNA phosphorothioation-associated protein 4 [Thermoguttaceae bacterium]|jgi:dnd system-associated protein 4|nr:DNA phosphorothioation-associated protein 4 [Thermoguttaceae bacterium]